MFKNLITLCLIILSAASQTLAADNLIKITPLNDFDTCTKQKIEGKELLFKVLEGDNNIKENEIITGKILKYQENGYSGQQAKIVIGNFKKSDGKKVAGEVYLYGNEHNVYDEYMNSDSNIGAVAIPFLRGGEIKLKRGEILSFFTNHEQTSEKLNIDIQPIELISTCHDETQINDIIRFKILNDVYYNDKLYIKKNSRLIGIVDYVQDNGWDYDSAQIQMKKFKTRDVNGNIVEIQYPLEIDGFEILKYKGKRFAQMFNYAGILWRGKEIEIIPNQDKNVTFTIWLTK